MSIYPYNYQINFVFEKMGPAGTFEAMLGLVPEKDAREKSSIHCSSVGTDLILFFLR